VLKASQEQLRNNTFVSQPNRFPEADTPVKPGHATVESDAGRVLQQVSTILVQPGNIGALYEQILDAAVALLRADYASMQVLYPERGPRGELRLLCHRGFSGEAAKFWEWVTPETASTCGEALRTGRRVIAQDVRSCPFMADRLDAFLAGGILAAQTTPLFSRSGALLGMLTTHWSQPHAPTEGELNSLDILARMAADLIERTLAGEELRRANDELEARVAERTAELELEIVERKQAEAALEAELAAARLIQQVSTQLIQAEGIEALYEKLLETAATLLRSDCASIQVLCPERGELRLLSSRGLGPDDAAYWEWVNPAARTSCGMAMTSG